MLTTKAILVVLLVKSNSFWMYEQKDVETCESSAQAFVDADIGESLGDVVRLLCIPLDGLGVGV